MAPPVQQIQDRGEKSQQIEQRTDIVMEPTGKMLTRQESVVVRLQAAARCWHFLASLLKIDYKSIISNGTRNVRCWYTITIVTSER